MTHWQFKLAVCALLVALQVSAQSYSPSEAIAFEQQGKLAEATQAWQGVIRQNPRDAGAYASLGVVFAKQEKYPEAAAAYRKAISLNPKLPGMQLNLGLGGVQTGPLCRRRDVAQSCARGRSKQHAGAHTAWTQRVWQ